MDHEENKLMRQTNSLLRDIVSELELMNVKFERLLEPSPIEPSDASEKEIESEPVEEEYLEPYPEPVVVVQQRVNPNVQTQAVRQHPVGPSQMVQEVLPKDRRVVEPVVKPKLDYDPLAHKRGPGGQLMSDREIRERDARLSTNYLGPRDPGNKIHPMRDQPEEGYEDFVDEDLKEFEE